MKIIKWVLVILIVLLIAACQADKPLASSEQMEIEQGLSDLEKLDQLNEGLDDLSLDELNDLEIE